MQDEAANIGLPTSPNTSIVDTQYAEKVAPAMIQVIAVMLNKLPDTISRSLKTKT